MRGGNLINSYRLHTTWTANNSTLSEEDDHLIAYWKKEDLTEEINNYTLTNNGSVTFSAGKHNDCAVFSGSNSLSRANNANFNLGDTYTIAFWLHPTSDVTKDCLGKMLNSSPYTGWNFRRFAGGGCVWYYTNVEKLNNSAGSELSINNWHQVMIACDNGDGELFINGSSIVTAASIGAAPEYNTSLFWGDRALSANGLPCKIDEAAIWKGYGANSTFAGAHYNATVGSFRI